MKTKMHEITFYDAKTNPPTITGEYLCFRKDGYGIYKYDAEEKEWQFYDPEWTWMGMNPEYFISWSDVKTDGTVCWWNSYMDPHKKDRREYSDED